MDEPLQRPAKVSGSRALPSRSLSPSGRVKVLVVEDDDGSREMIKMLLELERAEVFVAADGNEGLEAILRERPHVALVDIGLPGIDGLQVARRAREALSREEIWLVAMTGYGGDEDRLAVTEAGFDEHLVKPVPIDEIYRILHDAQQVHGVDTPTA